MGSLKRLEAQPATVLYQSGHIAYREIPSQVTWSRDLAPRCASTWARQNQNKMTRVGVSGEWFL